MNTKHVSGCDQTQSKHAEDEGQAIKRKQR